MNVSASFLHRKAKPIPGFFVWRLWGFSGLISKRAAITACALSIGLALVIGVSLTFGSQNVAFSEALLASVGVGEPRTVFLVQELRLMRVLAGVLTGFAFGVAGCLLQTLAHNRLATPGVIGIDDGATAFAVASIVAVPLTIAPSMLALTGAITAAVLAFGLSGGAGARGYRFIVVGIGVGALLSAVTNFMLARADMDSANAAYPWTVGSLNARNEQSIWLLAGALVLFLPFIGLIARPLSTLRFSPHVATGLGLRLNRARIMVLLLAVVLTALAVGVVGPVGLIALLAPECARYLSGHKTVPIFNAGLAGALVMVLADWIGRVLFAPVEIPVGVILAVVGGPYLLWIVLRPNRRF
jgi:iron complex transport system permease protein